jgi:hypothetical protein
MPQRVILILTIVARITLHKIRVLFFEAEHSFPGLLNEYAHQTFSLKLDGSVQTFHQRACAL